MIKLQIQNLKIKNRKNLLKAKFKFYNLNNYLEFKTNNKIKSYNKNYK